MSKFSYDVVIVGGAATGSSVAYFLAANPDFRGSIAIIEMDPTFATSATALSSSSIRQQFSNPINVQISLFGCQFIREFADSMKVDAVKPDLNFCENGYLYLASTEKQEQVLRINHETQLSCGADIVLLDTADIASAFPHLNVDDIRLASYGRSGEGWFSNTGLMDGFRRKARHLGADYMIGEVTGISRVADRVANVTLANGDRIDCGFVVNASGTRGAKIAAMTGLEIPVEPRKRSIFIVSCENSPQGTATVNGGQLPLMIDASGTFCRPEGEFFMAGISPKLDQAVELEDFEPEYDQFETMWIHLASRSPNFEAIKLVNCWAGHYDYNTLDQNVIVGPHNEVGNFIFANGYSGHGLQQSPAIGRGIAELIVYGEFKTLDLSQLGYDRVARNEPFMEDLVI